VAIGELQSYLVRRIFLYEVDALGRQLAQVIVVCAGGRGGRKIAAVSQLDA
jgi:hypothetical protein